MNSKGKAKQFNPCLIRKIFKRDGGVCVYCGMPAQEIDHVIPVRNKGPTITSNGVCCCKKCNCIRRNKPEDLDMLTRAIFWLMSCGEDVDWIDDFYK